MSYHHPPRPELASVERDNEVARGAGLKGWYSRLVCRLRGHRLRFYQFDPITVTHSLRCNRCGLTGWPNEYVNDPQGE